MRLALMSLLMIPLAAGCGAEKEDVASCKDTLRVMGQFQIGDTVLSIDEVLGDGFAFSIEHKIDIDIHEAGCISDIVLEMKHDGLGCRLSLDLVGTGAGEFSLSSVQFDADSYCPDFDDDLEGRYLSTTTNDLNVSGIPSQIEMESGTEERVCLDDVGYKFEGYGTMSLDGSSTVHPFQIDLALTGDTWSMGSTSADCEVQVSDDELTVAVSAGGSHTCSLTPAGIVECWGYYLDGQTNPPSNTFATVSAGGGNTCGITTSDGVACWGWDEFGQSSHPSGNFTTVSAGWVHTCGVTTSGLVECWGDDEFGQSNHPSGNFTTVSAGGYHTCGITTSDRVACWGRNHRGQSNPPSGTFATVSAGWWHTCGVRTSGVVECWGSDDYGQSTPPPGTFTTVNAGYGHNCGLTPSGSVNCWGYNEDGQTNAPSNTFATVSAGGLGFGSHSCGVTTSGIVECWGSDNSGQSSPPGP